MKKIKLAYLGGGSKNWARGFMNDLTMDEDLYGEIALYDIDLEAAKLNAEIGARFNALPDAKTHWDYVVYDNLKDALTGADFVAASILPGTFDEMSSDVHLPEAYGIFQTVGDTAGPGGVLRAMRTAPIYEEFARAIEKYCPNAWVVNMTNPMSICVKTLYDVFPGIKAFGCCHEVLGTQKFLAAVAAEELGIPTPAWKEVAVDVCGVNHFTWITKASYKGHDLLAMLPDFIKKYYATGCHVNNGKFPADFTESPFLSGNKVKMDLFLRYGVLGAAGDRHLVEFLNHNWYLGDRHAYPGPADGTHPHYRNEEWLFGYTDCTWRKNDGLRLVQKSKDIAAGLEPIVLKHSEENILHNLKALDGFGALMTNTNTPNVGQMPQMPLGAIVETNHLFEHNRLQPITATPLPGEVATLVRRCSDNIDNLYNGIKHRDLNEIFEVFMEQQICCNLNQQQGKELFGKMVENTKKYLTGYYEI